MEKRLLDTLSLIKNHVEPSEIFSALFHSLLDSFDFKYIALVIFQKDSLFYCRQENLDRESFYLTSPDNIPFIQEFFKAYCSGDSTLTNQKKEVFLKKILDGRFSNVLVYPLHQHGHVIGGILIPLKEESSCKGLDKLQKFIEDVSKVLSKKALFADEISMLKECLQGRCAFGSLIGKSPAMQEVYDMVEKIAGADITVLIQGETGTGKELLARTIHNKSQRRNYPFIRAYCSAYTSTLMQSELFGHEKGAFTGAFKRKKGRFELADKGTLFLDEIGEINEQTQVLLLRFLETREFERVGGETTLKSNARIITATNRNLEEMVAQKKFREDLFFRLNMVTITMPPLREKKEDIPLLIRHLLHQFCQKSGKMVAGVSDEAMSVLMQYHWPGNVRELKGVIERGFHLTKYAYIDIEHLPPHLLKSCHDDSSVKADEVSHEKEIIIETLKACRGNKKAAAKMLGISRPTLYQRLKRFGLMQ